MPPRKYFEFKVSEMPFPRLWGRFDRNLMIGKRHYNVSKFAVWLEFSNKFDFPTSKYLYILSIGRLVKFEHQSRLGWRKVCYIL